jgi:hypothetical protein
MMEPMNDSDRSSSLLIPSSADKHANLVTKKDVLEIEDN